MLLIIGALIATASVLIGYGAHGGNIPLLIQPLEWLIIFGAAGGAFIIANPVHVIKGTVTGSLGLLKPSPYSKQMYLDLLSLLFDIFSKARKEGLMSIEGDVEEPHSSELFSKYPSVMKDHHAVDFITDYLRFMVGGNMNTFELENLMDAELESHHHEAEQPSHALNSVADALPGYGIIAAVLGIVIALGFLDQEVAVVGQLVAIALIGTFMGILMGYTYVGPAAQAMAKRVGEQSNFLKTIKVCLIASMNGYNPQIAIEFGRKVMPGNLRPSFVELEEYIKGR